MLRREEVERIKEQYPKGTPIISYSQPNYQRNRIEFAIFTPC